MILIENGPKLQQEHTNSNNSVTYSVGCWRDKITHILYQELFINKLPILQDSCRFSLKNGKRIRIQNVGETKVQHRKSNELKPVEVH